MPRQFYRCGLGDTAMSTAIVSNEQCERSAHEARGISPIVPAVAKPRQPVAVILKRCAGNSNTAIVDEQTRTRRHDLDRSSEARLSTSQRASSTCYSCTKHVAVASDDLSRCAANYMPRPHTAYRPIDRTGPISAKRHPRGVLLTVALHAGNSRPQKEDVCRFSPGVAQAAGRT